jgi:hypothetical protein
MKLDTYSSLSVAEKAPFPSFEAPQTTLLAVSVDDPQTTLNPVEVLLPQTTELPHTTELPATFAPHTTEDPQTTEDPHTTEEDATVPFPLTIETFPVVGLYEAQGDKAEPTPAGAKSVLARAEFISTYPAPTVNRS